MKASFILLIFSIAIFSFSAINAQNESNTLDSLLNELRKAKHDTDKCDIYLKIGNFYKNGKPDSALYYYNIVKEIAKKSNSDNFQILHANSLDRMSFINCKILNNYDLADKYADNAIQILNELLSKNTSVTYRNEINKIIVSSFINKGNIYHMQAQYNKAIEFFMKSLKLSEETKNDEGVANSYISLGNVNEYIGDFQKSLEFFKKAYNIFKNMQNEKGIALSLGNIGNIYDDMGDFNTALKYNTKALNIYIRNSYKLETASIYNNMAIIYNEMGKNDTAIIFLSLLTD